MKPIPYRIEPGTTRVFLEIDGVPYELELRASVTEVTDCERRLPNGDPEVTYQLSVSQSFHLVGEARVPQATLLGPVGKPN